MKAEEAERVSEYQQGKGGGTGSREIKKQAPKGKVLELSRGGPPFPHPPLVPLEGSTRLKLRAQPQVLRHSPARFYPGSATGQAGRHFREQA